MPDRKSARHRPSYGLTGTLQKRLDHGLNEGLFAGSGARIAQAAARDWSRAAWAPAARLAEAARCDKAALSRFVQRLGYSDYTAFQCAARAMAEKDDPPGPMAMEADEDVNNQAKWLKEQLNLLEHDAMKPINALTPDAREGLADQVRLVAFRLSRARSILITSATPSAVQWLSPIRHIFASGLDIPVQILGSPKSKSAPEKGDHLIILHVHDRQRPDRSLLETEKYIWATSENHAAKGVHIVVGELAPAKTDAQRVLHLHDGCELTAGVVAMINICCVLVRATAQRKAGR